MKQYRVTDVCVNFGIGEILGLTDAQYNSRQHKLEKLSGNKYRATGIVQFKRGEVINLENVPDKGTLSKLEETKHFQPEVKAVPQKEKKPNDAKV